MVDQTIKRLVNDVDVFWCACRRSTGNRRTRRHLGFRHILISISGPAQLVKILLSQGEPAAVNTDITEIEAWAGWSLRGPCHKLRPGQIKQITPDAHLHRSA